MLFQIDFSFFTDVANTTSIPIGWEGWGHAGSHIVAGTGYINTENSQMASTGAIFTFTYHTKQLNLWPNSSVRGVMNYSQLPACQGEMEPFEDHASTYGHLKILRNKPQQKHSGQLLAPIPA